MVNLTLVSSIAKSALVGAVATKLVDTFISTKINNRNDEKKWLRTTKFELFSKLTEEVIIMDKSNVNIQLKEIKRQIAKIVLVIDDKVLTKNLEKYLEVVILNHNNSYSVVEQYNKKLVSYLRQNIRK